MVANESGWPRSLTRASRGGRGSRVCLMQQRQCRLGQRLAATAAGRTMLPSSSSLHTTCEWLLLAGL